MFSLFKCIPFHCSPLVPSTHLWAGQMQPFGDKVRAWTGHDSSWLEWSRVQAEEEGDCGHFIQLQIVRPKKSELSLRLLFKITQKWVDFLRSAVAIRFRGLSITRRNFRRGKPSLTKWRICCLEGRAWLTGSTWTWWKRSAASLQITSHNLRTCQTFWKVRPFFSTRAQNLIDSNFNQSVLKQF